ncbi:MAG TPA: ABC transporter permease [Spirochaetota bacterium]|nr:ABC transporter permease [Spirochaetota bacterium]HRZ27253.1 ABC transporter permease [Spirochaetota bacterium]HSA15983.1 ABC transporter permease [Spirochaetota bacterium]
MKRPNSKIPELALSLPTMGWLVVLFIIPTIVILLIAFRTGDPYGGIGDQWTVENFSELANPVYRGIMVRTVVLSVLTTAICLVLGVPAGYCLARAEKKKRDFLLLLIIVPFWINFLIRIFAWKVVLHPEGIVKNFLLLIGIVNDQTLLLYRPGTVLLVMVYSYIPFAVLPIYAAAEKFDFSLLDAAHDLGANWYRAFYRVFLPGIRQGILTAILVVFIPALGSYVIPDIVGGPGGEMIGNKIAQKTFIDRHLPHASVLSSLLVLAVMIPMTASLFMKRRKTVGRGIIPG